ncbi:MAG: HAD family hydrolase, partial [Miltoncostaeaceae bacterium]
MSRCAYLDLDGTLLGPGGSLLTEDGRTFSDASVRALGLLREHGVPVVLVSGRSRLRLEAVAIAVGADGALAEMGALDAGYPTRDGQTVHEAIVETGLPKRLLEREGDLETHPLAAAGGREGSYVLR